MTPDVSVVIVAWRGAAFLPSCLAALRAALGALRAEILVVDNASGDGTPEVLRHAAPDARLLSNATNRGFGAAANQGAREAGGRCILFLNPDARPAAGCVEALARALDGPGRPGLVSARLVSQSGAPQPSAWPEASLVTLAFDALLLRNLAPRSRVHVLEVPKGGPPLQVPAVSGACLLVRRDCWLELGGFDERFFLYHEDWDLCLRARRAGWGVLVVPDATAIHDLGGSAFQDRAAFWQRYHESRAAFIRKHFDGRRRRLGLALQSLGLRLHATAARLAGRADEARHLDAARRALASGPRP